MGYSSQKGSMHQLLYSPWGHSQTNRLTWSRHLPLLRQGELAHSSMSISQCNPSKPMEGNTHIQSLDEYEDMEPKQCHHAPDYSVCECVLKYLAYRCRCNLLSGPSRWHHSGRDWSHIHWCPAHSVGRCNPEHSYSWTSPLCSYTSHHAHMGLALMDRKRKSEWESLGKIWNA